MAVLADGGRDPRRGEDQRTDDAGHQPQPRVWPCVP
jgi:hypothetical protein